MIKKIEGDKIYITKTENPILYCVTGENAEECRKAFEKYGIEYRLGNPCFTNQKPIRLDPKSNGFESEYYELNISPEDIKSLYGEILELEEEYGIDDPKIVLV